MVEILEIIEDYWDRIKEKPQNVIIALIITLVLIKPMFQISIFSGILFIITMIWIFLIKVEIFIDTPGYAIVIYAILAIRWAIKDVGKEGILNLFKGEVLTGIVFVIVWVMIYLRTKELERH